MQKLLKEMMNCVTSKAYYPALMTSVSIPDICAALESNGETNSVKYIKWFDTHAAKHFKTMLNGSNAYYLRCAILHQGRLSHRKYKQSFDEIMFVIENHEISTHLIELKRVGGKTYLVLELDKFCASIYRSANVWLKQVESTENYKKNYAKFFQRNNQPLPWDDHGMSIIASF